MITSSNFQIIYRITNIFYKAEQSCFFSSFLTYSPKRIADFAPLPLKILYYVTNIWAWQWFLDRYCYEQQPCFNNALPNFDCVFKLFVIYIKIKKSPAPCFLNHTKCLKDINVLPSIHFLFLHQAVIVASFYTRDWIC